MRDAEVKNDNIRKELHAIASLESDGTKHKNKLQTKLDHIDNKFEDLKAELMREKYDNKKVIEKQEDSIKKLAEQNN